MDAMVPEKKRKRSKAEKEARRAVKAQGLRWRDLDKPVRKGLVADAKLARTVKKVLGSAAAAPPAVTPDAVMTKAVLGPQINLDDAKSALAAIRAAIANPVPGASGFRP